MIARRPLIVFALVSIAVLLACTKRDPVGPGPPPPPQPPPPPGSGEVTLELVSDRLDTPVFLTAPPGDTQRLFVVEKPGLIRIIKEGALRPRPFLDVTGKTAGGYEQGLLGLAFDPSYSSNGSFYISYTDNSGDGVLARYHVTATNPDSADPVADRIVLTIDHPDQRENHNGGMVAFGPDGMLYLSHGDGGGGGDPLGSGQDRSDLLGNILRLDVSSGDPYRIPSDNPFGAPSKREIWCYGLRNPWRFSFDRQNGDLYIADVGQDAREEVDVATAASGRGKGLNFGWNLQEGNDCFATDPCNDPGLTRPVLDYPRSRGCSITGGYVYRGSVIPSLQGIYFYADYCRGEVRSFRYQGGAATDLRDWPELGPGGRITSFGEDGRGELYVMTDGGRLYRVVPQTTMAALPAHASRAR